MKHHCPENCVIHSHVESYHLLASCRNCGEKHVARFPKGVRPSPHDECPDCGVPGSLNYGTTQDVYHALERERLIDRALATVNGCDQQGLTPDLRGPTGAHPRRRWPWSRT